MLPVDENAFSHGLEFGRIIKMLHADRKRKAVQAVRSRLYARDPNQELKPDFSLQTSWCICEVNMLILHEGAVCYLTCLHFCLAWCCDALSRVLGPLGCESGDPTGRVNGHCCAVKPFEIQNLFIIFRF